jgi:protein O-GlcNAc transferase
MENAKRCYLEAIRIKPDFPIAWNNLAGIFKEEGKSVGISSTHLSIELWSTLGQVPTAIEYYKEAIRLCPEFADAHSNLGNALKV